jgi:hypothetical protein
MAHPRHLALSGYQGAQRQTHFPAPCAVLALVNNADSRRVIIGRGGRSAPVETDAARPLENLLQHGRL